MPLKIDCGDLELTVNIVVGTRYRLSPRTDQEKDDRRAMQEKLFDVMPEMEAVLLEQVATLIGYNPEVIKAKIKERADKFAADHAAETRGREERKLQRAGLPPLAPPPPPPPIIRDRDVSESDDTVANDD